MTSKYHAPVIVWEFVLRSSRELKIPSVLLLGLLAAHFPAVHRTVCYFVASEAWSSRKSLRPGLNFSERLRLFARAGKYWNNSTVAWGTCATKVEEPSLAKLRIIAGIIWGFLEMRGRFFSLKIKMIMISLFAPKTSVLS